MARSIAVVGGGVAGLAAAYQLARLQSEGHDLSFKLFEQSDRLGGILETHRESGFVVECGPDGWVTEKPWARELAEEMGLGADLLASNDETRRTYVLHRGRLEAMPDNMRMMVPADLDAVEQSPLFSVAAREQYRAEVQRAEELKRLAPDADESVASFVERHFGAEVLRVIGAPLLGGVFGGDVHRLSVRAVMKPFVEMEREHGSLIVALQRRAEQKRREGRSKEATFTSLRLGTGALAEAMAWRVPRENVKLRRWVAGLARNGGRWRLQSIAAAQPVPGLQSRKQTFTEDFDHVLLAAPVNHAAKLLSAVDAEMAERMRMPTSSAVIAAMCWQPGAGVEWPQGFGFLAPQGEGSKLLAATFSDQKYAHRVPEGGRMVRAYFGGQTADHIAQQSDREIARVARAELESILGRLPEAALTVVRRWPHALPQYEVGHLERMADLDARVRQIGGLHLLGNGYRGVGLPELIRDGRAAACEAALG